MSDITEFGFDDGDEKVGRKFDRFKPETGKSYRVSFCWFKNLNADGTPDWDKGLRFARCQRIYLKGVGQILYKGPTYAEFGKPAEAISTVVAIWPTTNKGVPDAANLSDVVVAPWVFSTDKYLSLKNHNARFPLAEVDYTINCKDAQFQKLEFFAENKSLLRSLLSSENEDRKLLAKSVLKDARS